ncbi:MAG: nicotinate-nucleotide pyrophosphorylase (carboxylating) [Oleiphilaceae bacterium]|jgi:nicotinate-nucleotide pyrophosphorylase (carboxylating)
MNTALNQAIQASVQLALQEDIGSGDITAQLISEEKTAQASVITREDAIICGIDWVNEVFKSISDKLNIEWFVSDGEKASANTTLFKISGSARAILTGERAALNFLQTLSGTATLSHKYAKKVAHTKVKLLDTRKTIPGLRLAQKYAVKCGGCFNHRLGLYDAFLIKENHIMACGGINNAIQHARIIAPDKPVEVEVENLKEFDQALNANADIIMLDNFSLSEMKQAVSINQGNAKLEASGNVNFETLVPIAETGVDFISIGALTKDCKSIDLSMRIST